MTNNKLYHLISYQIACSVLQCAAVCCSVLHCLCRSLYQITKCPRVGIFFVCNAKIDPYSSRTAVCVLQCVLQSVMQCF